MRKRFLTLLCISACALMLGACSLQSEAAKQVGSQIDALPTAAELTLEDEKLLSDVEAAYGALTEQEKERVDGEKLTQLCAQMQSLLRIKDVQTKVNALTALSLEKLFAYDQAKTAYAVLTEIEKTKVNVELLAEAERFFCRG